jgi:hypothetical protein
MGRRRSFGVVIFLFLAEQNKMNAGKVCEDEQTKLDIQADADKIRTARAPLERARCNVQFQRMFFLTGLDFWHVYTYCSLQRSTSRSQLSLVRRDYIHSFLFHLIHSLR